MAFAMIGSEKALSILTTMKTKSFYVVQAAPVDRALMCRWNDRSNHRTVEAATNRIKRLKGKKKVHSIRYRVIKRTDEVVYE